MKKLIEALTPTEIRNGCYVAYNGYIWEFKYSRDRENPMLAMFGCAEVPLYNFKSMFRYIGAFIEYTKRYSVPKDTPIYECKTKEQFFMFFGLALEFSYGQLYFRETEYFNSDYYTQAPGYGRLGFIGWSPAELRTFSVSGVKIGEILEFLNKEYQGVHNHFRIVQNQFVNSNHTERALSGAQNTIWCVVVVHGDRSGKTLWQPNIVVTDKTIVLSPNEEKTSPVEKAAKVIRAVVKKRAPSKKAVPAKPAV